MDICVAVSRSQALRAILSTFQISPLYASPACIAARHLLQQSPHHNARQFHRSVAQRADKYRRIDVPPTVSQQIEADPTIGKGIRARTGRVVDPNGQLGEERFMGLILAEVNQINVANPEDIIHVQKVGETAEGAAICKFVSVRTLAEQLRIKQKAVKSANKGAARTKQVEMTWRISDHDLMYRLKRIREFLSDGRKVEVLIAPKKRSLPAERSEIEAVVARLNETVKEIPGATVWKEPEGDIGRRYLMFFKGNAQADEQQPPQEEAASESRLPDRGAGWAEEKKQRALTKEEARKKKEVRREQRRERHQSTVQEED